MKRYKAERISFGRYSQEGGKSKSETNHRARTRESNNNCHHHGLPSLLPEHSQQLPLQLIHQSNLSIPGAVTALFRGPLFTPLLAPHVSVPRAAAASMEALRFARCANGGGGLGDEDCVGAFGGRGLWVAYVSRALKLSVLTRPRMMGRGRGGLGWS